LKKLGNEAEELVYKFCVVNRHQLIFEHLLPSGAIPKEGLTVKHIVTGEDVHLSSYVLAAFLITTVADFIDQKFAWQDYLHGTQDGKMTYTDGDPGYLWPSEGKPGLWVNWSIVVATIIKKSNIENIVIPPLFNHFEGQITEVSEIQARNLYWEVITNYSHSSKAPEATEILENICRLNRYIAEPHALLGQLYIQKNEWEKAEKHVNEALKLFQLWGTNWDKHMSWTGWVAWTRVLAHSIKEKTWPKTSHGIISLGLVK